MALTVKIDTRSNAAKRLVEYLQTLPFVKVGEGKDAAYNQEMIEKIRKAEKEIEEGKYRVHKSGKG
ncbi:MAG TPA: hypothetical protein PK110_04095 [Niabella sp.]|jgi:hypothetical protein|nr:hypothetical protein [Niabella sp.]